MAGHNIRILPIRRLVAPLWHPKSPNMSKMRKKSELPSKACATCGRPFVWRKKWEKVWDQVRYCSDKCRMQRSG